MKDEDKQIRQGTSVKIAARVRQGRIQGNCSCVRPGLHLRRLLPMRDCHHFVQRGGNVPSVHAVNGVIVEEGAKPDLRQKKGFKQGGVSDRSVGFEQEFAVHVPVS